MNVLRGPLHQLAAAADAGGCNEMSGPDAYQDEMRRLLLGELGVDPLALDQDTADRLHTGRLDLPALPRVRGGRGHPGGRRQSSHPPGAGRRCRRGSDRNTARAGQADGRLGQAGGASPTGPVCRCAAGPGQGPERRRGPGRRSQRGPRGRQPGGPRGSIGPRGSDRAGRHRHGQGWALCRAPGRPGRRRRQDGWATVDCSGKGEQADQPNSDDQGGLMRARPGSDARGIDHRQKEIGRPGPEGVRR